MSKVGKWSTTPGNNNSTPPDGWPEGQAPSTVNDCAREMMAAIRTYLNDAQYFDRDNTPSFLTATTFSLATADATNFHVGRRVKLLDTATLYGTIDSVSATFVSVCLDDGALTAALSSVGLAVIGETGNSLPASTWSRRNVLINGSMDVWQRGNGPFTPVNSTALYSADRFSYLQSCSAAVNITRAERSASSANVPGIAQAGVIINSSLRISVSAVDAALAAGEFGLILYRVEGYDWRQIAHKPNVLSFWCSTNRTGIYACAIRNTFGSASYVQNYTVSAANTWQRFSVTIPEAPTTVTWDYSQSTGALISFALGTGTTNQGGAGNWTAANIVATSSQTNFLASAGNVFMLTGVQLEEGSRATPLEFKNFSDELARCQRYYWRGLPGTALNFPAYTASTIMSWPITFPVTMRAAPTVATVTPGISMTNLVSTPSISLATPNGARIIANGSVASVNTNFVYLTTDYFEADAEI